MMPGTLDAMRDEFRIAEELLGWFARSARDLPWRRTRDPYAIWVSEVMLQQTQVKTALPFWRRWMDCFPNVRALAGASMEDVLRRWAGLGYYSRARQLRAAARHIVAERNGILPERFEDWLALPGVGRYTAGAVCSIAFNQPYPVLDGNAARVLARVYAWRPAPADRRGAALWDRARALVEAAPAAPAAWARGRLNEALMELGATLCSPRQPRCAECPIASFCRAKRIGRAEAFGLRKTPVKTVRQENFAFAFWRRNRLLLRRRPDRGVNGGLWEFPNVELDSLRRGRAPDVGRLARELAGALPRKLAALGEIRHAITRRRIRVRAFFAEIGGGDKIQTPGGRWMTLLDAERLPLPSAHGEMLRRLQGYFRADAAKRERSTSGILLHDPRPSR